MHISSFFTPIHTLTHVFILFTTLSRLYRQRPRVSSALMLLTLKPAQQPEYGNTHAYSPAQRSPSSYYNSPPQSASLPAVPDSILPRGMSTPHRGLPPPSAMERMIPNNIDRQPPSNLPLGALPAAPAQWQGQDESMRSWLHAKSEEDRRKQEEERTRQEGLRLDQRKIEQKMLTDALQGQVPPPMVPMIFAGIGGGNLANMSVEWAQHYMAQISLQHQAQVQQQQQQQQIQQQVAQPQLTQQPQIQQSSPEQRRDRMITGPNPNPYGPQQMPQPAQSVQQSPAITNFVPSYQANQERSRPHQPALQAAPPTSNPRPQSQQTGISRHNTGDLAVQQLPTPSATSRLPISGSHPIHQAQSAQAQEQASSSPTLYFHHYVPPGAPKEKGEHGTPSGKSQHSSPNFQNPGSHLRSEYTTSPKKRKATGSHPAPPEPSPSFSQQSSGGTSSSTQRRRQRSRQRSDASSRDMQAPSNSRQRSGSNRQSFSEAESGRNSAQPETRQNQPPLSSTGQYQQQHVNSSVGKNSGTGGAETRLDGGTGRQVSRDLNDRNSPKREP